MGERKPLPIWLGNPNEVARRLREIHAERLGQFHGGTDLWPNMSHGGRGAWVAVARECMAATSEATIRAIADWLDPGEGMHANGGPQMLRRQLLKEIAADIRAGKWRKAHAEHGGNDDGR